MEEQSFKILHLENIYVAYSHTVNPGAKSYINLVNELGLHG